jgi:hypothetical protein
MLKMYGDAIKIIRLARRETALLLSPLLLSFTQPTNLLSIMIAVLNHTVSSC